MMEIYSVKIDIIIVGANNVVRENETCETGWKSGGKRRTEMGGGMSFKAFNLFE
jgi:hypothetical protein